MAEEVTSIGIKMETDGVARGIKSLDELAARGPKVEKAMEGVAKATEKASQSTSKIGQGATGLDAFSSKGQGAARAIDSLGNAAGKASRSTESLGKNLREAGDGASVAGRMAKGFAGDLNEANRASVQFANSLDGLTSFLKGTLAGILGGLSISGFISQLVSVQREFDRLNASLITVSGSSAAAQSEMAWLKTFAKETPFGLAQATEAFVKMRALGLNPTKEALTSFGNTASAMGKDMMQFVEAVADATTGEFERLKEFGIKASKEGDKVSLTFQGVTKTIGNSADEINRYLTSIGDNEFAGAMEQRLHTLDGAIAGLGDSWDEFLRTISSSGVGDALADTVRGAANAFDSYSQILAVVTAYQKEARQTATGVEEDFFSLANGAANLAILTAEASHSVQDFGQKIGGLAAAGRALATDGLDAARAVIRDLDADGRAAEQRMEALRSSILNLLVIQQNARSAIAAEAGGGLDAYLSGAIDRSTSKPPKPPRGNSSSKRPKDRYVDLADQLINESLGLNGDYEKQLAALFKQYESGALHVDKYRAAVEQLIAKQPFAKELAKQHADVLKEQAKAAQEAAKASFDLQVSLAGKISDINDQIAKERELQQSYGLTEIELRALEAARLDDAAATAEWIAMMAESKEGNAEAAASYRLQAERLRALAAEKRKTDRVIRDNEAVKAWADTFKDIDSAMRDVFVNMTDDIGSSFDRLWKSIKAGFMSMLYQLTLQRWVINIGASLTGTTASQFAGLMGINTSGGLWGTVSDLSSGQSVYSALTGNNPVLNAIGNYLGWGNTLGAGQGVLAAGSPGAAGAWTGLGAGQGVLASGAPGAAGAYTGGTAGMWGSLGTAAWIAAPVAVGLWGMSSMPDRPDYSGYASASSDPTRDRAPMTASGTIFDLTEGIIPDRDALIAAMGAAGVSGRTGITTGPEDRLTGGSGRGEISSAINQAGVSGADVGRLSNRDLYGLISGNTAFYTGAGYVDPSSMWRDGMEGVRDWTYSAEMTQWGRQVAEGVLTSIETLASQFNLGTDFSVIAGMRDEAKRDLIYAGLRISQGDETLIDYEGKVGKGGAQEALRQYAAQTLEAFKKLDLPEWARALVEQTQTAINELDGEELGDQLGQTALTAVDQLNASLAQTVAVLTRLGKTVLEFGDYGQDVIYQITSLMGGVDQFGAAYSAYVQAFYEPQEQLEYLQRQVREQFDALGVAMPDSIKGFRRLVDTLNLADEADQRLFASLLSISPAFAQLTEEMGKAEDAVKEATKTVADLYAEAKANTDGSFAAYQKNQQKVIDQWSDVQTAAEETADEVRGIFDMLHDSVRELRGEVASTRAMQADQANEFISAALVAARATGVLPEYDGLSDAISGARAGLDSSRYSSRDAYEKDQLILANKLEELEGYADSQLTTAERQIQYAKEQIALVNREIELYQKQIDEMRTGNQYLGTIAELAAAILNERSAAAAAAAGEGGGGGAGAGGGVSFPGGSPGGKPNFSTHPTFGTREEAEAAIAEMNANGDYAYLVNVGGAWTAWRHGTGSAEYRRAQNLRESLSTVGSAEEWWSAAAASGATLTELASALGAAPDDLREWVKKNLPGYQWGAGNASLEKIPSYDVGTAFVPADGLAMIHKGERIFTAADNRMITDAITRNSNDQNTERMVQIMQAGFGALTRQMIEVKRQLKFGVMTTDQLQSTT